MYSTCPKCGHARKPEDTAPEGICPACGLVFAKWVERALGRTPVRQRVDVDEQTDASAGVVLREILLPPLERVDPIQVYGRTALYLLFVVWGVYFIMLDLRTNEIGHSFMHRINLVFHEAGHVIFMPFGHFLMVLGGTLGQLLMPLIVGGSLLWKNRDAFGASLALWWFGQSLMDCAPYINDARDLQLMLLGGGTGADRPGMHDWENILLDLGLIQHERAIALGADRLGELFMLLAFAWGGAVLRMQWARLRGRGADA
jgi:hypothetical protein